MLTKPANHQLMASCRVFLAFFSVDILVGLVIMVASLMRMQHKVASADLVMFCISISAGAVILYSFWIALGTLSIWTVKLENLMLVFYSMFEAGRWPSGLYPFWLRYSITFLVPIAFAITVPAEAIVGRLQWHIVAQEVAWAAVVFLGSRWFFNYGVGRRYTGASA
jgi:ABC-2 type transport system permease protein